MNMSVGAIFPLVRHTLLNSKSVVCRQVLKHGCGYRYKSYDAEGKTSVSILNIDPSSGLMIDAYSQMGFRLNNGMSIIGPIAIFPKTVLSWNVESVEAVNEESLSLFCCLEPKIDILILGLGDVQESKKFNRELIKFMRTNKINIEMLPTEQACSTFNFLNSEKRYVAGALIPPSSVRIIDDDIIATKMQRTRLEIQND